MSDNEETSDNEVEVKTEKTVKVKKNSDSTSTPESQRTGGLIDPRLGVVSEKNAVEEDSMEQVD